MNDKAKSQIVWEQWQVSFRSARNAVRDVAGVGHRSVLAAPEQVAVFLHGAMGDV